MCLFLFLALVASASETPPPTGIEETMQGVLGEVLPDGPGYGKQLFTMILTLLGLVVFIILTFWFLRRLSQGRMSNGSGSKKIRVLERRPLSPKSVLFLIEIGGKKVMIAESQLEVRTIMVVEESEKVE